LVEGEYVKNIVVLVSGGGTNLGALIAAEKRGEITGGRITCVISSSPNAYALERAAASNIRTRVIDRANADFTKLLLAALAEENADLIVLAGFLVILEKAVIGAYPNKIINVHPSLIPSFCGDGFYGLRVHRAALEAGVKLSGATVHFVSEITDGGAIIAQKAVEVLPDDTPETLQKRVMEEAEHVLLPQAVNLLTANGV